MERQAKKKVLIDIYCLLVADTGIRKYIEELIQLVKENPDSDFEYIFVPSVDKVNQTNNFRKKPFIVFRLISQIENLLWKQFFIPYKLWKLQADVAFFPDYYAPAWKTKTLKVVMFHDTFFWDEPGHYGKWWLKYFKRVTKLGLRGKSSVVTISNHVRANLQRVLAPNINVDVLYHPARREATRLGNNGVIEHLGLGRKKYFLHVGVFEKRKELPVLVRAFSEFLEKVDDPNNYMLVMVGRQAPNSRYDDWGEVMKLISKLGIKEKVVLPGYLSDLDIATLYKGAWSYIFPSKNEGFGIPVLEAFSAGCPLIISSQPALMEVAGDAALSFKVGNEQELTNKMLSLSNESRSRLIQLGKARLTLFKREAYLSNLESLFDNRLELSGGEYKRTTK